MTDNEKAEPKKGFLGRMFDKIDKAMQEKAKSGCCCCAPKAEKKDSKCCQFKRCSLKRLAIILIAKNVIQC